MRPPGKMSSILGIIAVLLSLVAFILGSAPFTPAIILVFAAVPLALAAAIFGSWRLATIAVYFSIAAWFVVPLSLELAVRIDYFLVLVGVIGMTIIGALLYGHKRTIHVT